jgi:WD40 repeat protein
MRRRLNLLATVVSVAAASCSKCAGGPLAVSAVPAREAVGLTPSPGPVPELTPPSPAEPDAAPVLVKTLRVGAETSFGRVVLSIDPKGQRLAASGTWRSPRSLDVKSSAIAVWSLTTFERELSTTPGTVIDALALGDEVLAFGGGPGTSFQVVPLKGCRTTAVALKTSVPRRTGSPTLSRLVFSADGARLAGCVDYSEDVLVWTLPDFTEVMRGRHDFECERLSFSRDGAEVALRFSLGRNRVWDARTGQLTRAFADEHFSEFTWSDLSPSGRLLATSTDADPVVLLWDTRSGQVVARVDATDQGGPFSLVTQFHPAGHLLVTSDGSGTLKLWRLAPVSLVASWQLEGEITELRFTPDGRTLVAASGEGVVSVFRWPSADGGVNEHR